MFVQVMHGKTSDPEALHRRLEVWEAELMPGAVGYLGSTGGCTSDGDCILIARFEDRESARRNSDRPEQGAWWAETEKCFDGPVTFFDCPQVDVWMQGGSDDAGFVQVMEGHTSDPARMRDMLLRNTHEMHRRRPEIIGGTMALHGDGAFVETVYFTSEEEARQRESMPPPQELADAMRDGQLMDDLTFLDLHEPWLVSPGR